MKPNTLKKKLALTKTTVSNLEIKTMEIVIGGKTANTCHTICNANPDLSYCMCDTGLPCEPNYTRAMEACKVTEYLPC